MNIYYTNQSLHFEFCFVCVHTFTNTNYRVIWVSRLFWCKVWFLDEWRNKRKESEKTRSCKQWDKRWGYKWKTGEEETRPGKVDFLPAPSSSLVHTTSPWERWEWSIVRRPFKKTYNLKQPRKYITNLSLSGAGFLMKRPTDDECLGWARREKKETL